MSRAETIARLAYAEYGRTTGFKNYQGLPMPKWEDLTDTIKQAWENAAKAVWQFAVDETRTPPDHK